MWPNALTSRELPKRTHARSTLRGCLNRSEFMSGCVRKENWISYMHVFSVKRYFAIWWHWYTFTTSSIEVFHVKYVQWLMVLEASMEELKTVWWWGQSFLPTFSSHLILNLQTQWGGGKESNVWILVQFLWRCNCWSSVVLSPEKPEKSGLQRLLLAFGVN